MHNGWYQIALEKELTLGINATWLGEKPLMIILSKDNETPYDNIAVYDAECPHRGANLALGGTLKDNVVTCPFHGYEIALQAQTSKKFHVQRYKCLNISGLIFIKQNDTITADKGFQQYITQLDQNYYISPSFTLELDIKPELVIENAFDINHFKPVHGVLNASDFYQETSIGREFAISGTFTLPPSPWQSQDDELNTAVSVPFTARAFSPNIVISKLGGAHPYLMMTTATPYQSMCKISLTIMLEVVRHGKKPPLEQIRYLTKQAKAGVEKDIPIWNCLPTTEQFQAVDGDHWVLAFREFCDTFDNI